MKQSFLTCLLLSIFSSGFASVTVDCNSEAYNYSPAVQEACKEMQQDTKEARKDSEQRFSKFLSEKKASIQSILKNNAKPNENNPSNSNHQDQQPSPSTAPTMKNVAPTTSTNPSKVEAVTNNSNGNNPTNSTSKPTSNDNSGGVNYY